MVLWTCQKQTSPMREFTPCVTVVISESDLQELRGAAQVCSGQCGQHRHQGVAHQALQLSQVLRTLSFSSTLSSGLDFSYTLST